MTPCWGGAAVRPAYSRYMSKDDRRTGATEDTEYFSSAAPLEHDARRSIALTNTLRDSARSLALTARWASWPWGSEQAKSLF